MCVYVSVCVCVCVCVYPFLLLKAECDTKSIFKQGKFSLNLFFLFLDWLPYQG